MGFKLDTTGAIDTAPGDNDRGRLVWWHNLNAFTQGYVEALFAGALSTGLDTSFGWNTLRPEACRFDKLAPETLSRIIADCEGLMTKGPYGSFVLDRGAITGAEFWKYRQEGKLESFMPPLTVQLGDDGRVRFV